MDSVELDKHWPVDETKPNIASLYEYTEVIWQSIRANVLSLNTRLGVTIGFAGVMLRFALDLPDGLALLVGLKVAGCLLACAALVFALAGFDTKPTGEYAKPRYLLDDYYYRPEELVKLTIVDTWLDGIEQLQALQGVKNARLKIALRCLAGAGICFGASVIAEAMIG